MPVMKDVQNDPAQVPLSIDRVGVRGLRLPVVVRDRARGSRHSVAVVELSVDLPAEFKGTHMSRFVEVLKDWSDDQKLDHKGIHNLLKEVKHRLHARRSHVEFRFPFFQHRTAPATGSPGLMSYDCRMTGELDCREGKPSKLRYLLEVEVPVMTVCPCSLAICDHGAHSQRALIRMQTRFDGFLWLEDLIAIGEASGSSPVYPLLKREDEKAVVETAFSNPAFVEDAVRNAALALENHPQVRWFRVEVESCESIHNHNAFAAIEKHVDRLAIHEKKGTKP